MIRIRKMLAREGKSLLEELGAPDFATLLRRVTLWVRFYIGCGSIIGAVYAVYVLFGMAAMWIAVAGLFLFHAWLLNRTGGYAGNAEEMLELMGDSPPSLPPQPGKPQLPPSGTPQIGRASTAIARRSSNTSRPCRDGAVVVDLIDRPQSQSSPSCLNSWRRRPRLGLAPGRARRRVITFSPSAAVHHRIAYISDRCE
jgi:hypothetical protein